jgi:hypothetical protein
VGTLEFNHAVKGLFPIDPISVFVNTISTDGFKLTKVSQEADSMFAIYVFLAFCKFFQIVAYFGQNGMVRRKQKSLSMMLRVWYLGRTQCP